MCEEADTKLVRYRGTILVVLAWLMAADAAFLVCRSRRNGFEEDNPLAAVVIEHTGATGFFFIKAAVMLVCAVILDAAARHGKAKWLCLLAMFASGIYANQLFYWIQMYGH